MGVVKVEIPLEEDIAAELTDPVRLAAIGQLVSRIVRPSEKQDPLGAILDEIGRSAERAGLSQEDIDQELAAWKAERMARQG